MTEYSALRWPSSRTMQGAFKKAVLYFCGAGLAMRVLTGCAVPTDQAQLGHTYAPAGSEYELGKRGLDPNREGAVITAYNPTSGEHGFIANLSMGPDAYGQEQWLPVKGVIYPQPSSSGEEYTIRYPAGQPLSNLLNNPRSELHKRLAGLLVQAVQADQGREVLNKKNSPQGRAGFDVQVTGSNQTSVKGQVGDRSVFATYTKSPSLPIRVQTSSPSQFQTDFEFHAGGGPAMLAQQYASRHYDGNVDLYDSHMPKGSVLDKIEYIKWRAVEAAALAAYAANPDAPVLFEPLGQPGTAYVNYEPSFARTNVDGQILALDDMDSLLLKQKLGVKSLQDPRLNARILQVLDVLVKEETPHVLDPSMRGTGYAGPAGNAINYNSHGGASGMTGGAAFNGHSYYDAERAKAFGDERCGEIKIKPNATDPASGGEAFLYTRAPNGQVIPVKLAFDDMGRGQKPNLRLDSTTAQRLGGLSGPVIDELAETVSAAHSDALGGRASSSKYQRQMPSGHRQEPVSGNRYDSRVPATGGRGSTSSSQIQGGGSFPTAPNRTGANGGYGGELPGIKGTFEGRGGFTGGTNTMSPY